MSKVILLLAPASVVAFAVLLIVLLLGPSNEVDAQAVLDRAVNAEIRPGPDETLHLLTRQYSRVEPAENRPSDPYHYDLYEAEPETMYVDAWFKADQMGNVLSRYTAVMDSSGRLVQEESRAESNVERIYRPSLGGVQVLQVETSEKPTLRSISIPEKRPWSEVAIAGTGFMVGQETTIIEIRTKTSPVSGSDNVYQRPYTADLRPVQGLETVEIANDSGNVLRYSVDLLLDTGGVVRIVDTEVQNVEVVPGKPTDFFALKDGANAPLIAEAPARPPVPVTYSAVEDVPSGTTFVTTEAVITSPDSATILFLGSIVGAAEKREPDVPNRDIRTASMYGLSHTSTYTVAVAGPSPTVLRITVGSKDDLLPLLTSTPPWWHSSKEINVSIEGVRSKPWLMTGDGQMIVVERNGLLIVWEAQNLSEEDLVRAVAATVVRR